MEENNYSNIIKDQTDRALWEVQNVISCIPDKMWNKLYCNMPVWKHVYHMLHSLDLWFINPWDKQFKEPSFHVLNLNNLDIISKKELTKDELLKYCVDVKTKIQVYLKEIKEEDLLLKPADCEYTRFTLMLAQHRHLHSHMGMIMGFIISETGQWPRIIGLEGDIPKEENYGLFC